MKDNTGHLSEEEKNYEYKKMIHTLSSGKPLIRRGVFKRIFEILGIHHSKMQATPVDGEIYDRCVSFGYLHFGSIFNEKIKAAFDRYLLKYKVVPSRTIDHRGKPTNFGNITVYFKWNNIQWGLMDSDLMKKYPDAYKIDKRGCVGLDTYKVRKEKIKFKSLRCLATSNDVILKWSDISKSNISLDNNSNSVEEESENYFVEIAEKTLRSKGIKRCSFEKMGIGLVHSYISRYAKYHRFEVKDVAIWKENKVKYDL